MDLDGNEFVTRSLRLASDSGPGGQAQRSDIDNAINVFAGEVGTSLPEPWSRTVRGVARSRAVVDRALREDRDDYGVTTGFGKLSDRRIPSDHLEELQENLRGGRV